MRSSHHNNLKVACCIAVAFCWCSEILGQPASALKRETFTKTLRPPGSVVGPSVVITYEAAVFDPAEPVPTTGPVEWDTRTPEATFRAMLIANKEGDTNLIVRGFVPAERERIAGMVTQPEMLQKNTAGYARIAKVALLQKTFYGDFVILTTSQEDARGSQWALNFVFKRTAEGWLQTNELVHDPVVSRLIEIIAPKSPPKPK